MPSLRAQRLLIDPSLVSATPRRRIGHHVEGAVLGGMSAFFTACSAGVTISTLGTDQGLSTHMPVFVAALFHAVAATGLGHLAARRSSRAAFAGAAAAGVIALGAFLHEAPGMKENPAPDTGPRIRIVEETKAAPAYEAR